MSRTEHRAVQPGVRGPIKRFIRMPGARRRALAEALAALAIARLLVLMAPFRVVARRLARPLSRAAEDATREASIRQISQAIQSVARRVPFRALCFEQGLAAAILLRRRGIPAVLHYGMAQRDEGLAAHVWITAGNTDVIGCENSSEFRELARFPG